MWPSKIGPEDVCSILNCLVPTRNFHSKKINQFVEIFMSVAWPGVFRIGWGSGASSFVWCFGDRGFAFL